MNGKLFPRAALAVLTLAAALSAAAQTDDRLVVPLTDPSRPARLDVNLVFGSITVTAYNGNEVVIVAKEAANDDEDEDEDENEHESDSSDFHEPGANGERNDAEARRAGLRRISSSSFDLAVSERDNTVAVRMAGPPRSIDLEISVPRRTSVRAVTINNGVVMVNGVIGEHELQNHNGNVFANDIGGSAVISTQNGEVRASFAEVAAGKAMSFSSFNGDVDVAFPANLAAELRVNSGRGDLLTDFDVQVQAQAAIIERNGEPDPADGANRARGPRGGYQVRMKRELRALVGGGGAAMQFRTFNGDVLIRKR